MTVESSNVEDLAHINKRQQDILDILATHELLSLKEIMHHLPDNVQQRLVRFDLYTLKKRGLIDTRGRGRGAVWYIVESQK